MKKQKIKLRTVLFFLITMIYSNTFSQEIVAFIDKVTASDRESGDFFGGDGFDSNVSIFGDFAVVGASWEDDDTLGAAYLYQKVNGCTWVQTDKIVAQNSLGGPRILEENSQFGTDVKINGTTIAISAERVTSDGVIKAGAVYIYEIVFGIAELQQVITPENEFALGESDAQTNATFGSSIDLSADRLIVGARLNSTNENGAGPVLEGAGAAYIYHRVAGTFVFQDKIVAGDRALGDEFGRSVSIDGDFAVVGAPWRGDETGKAYVFQFEAGNWIEMQELEPTDLIDEDLYGLSVTVDGNFIGVGSPANKTDEDGIITGFDIGAVYMYDFDGTAWNEIQKITIPPPTSWFGRDIELWEDRIVIGSQIRTVDECGESEGWAGSAYTYQRNIDTELWDFDHQFSAPDRNTIDLFGTSVGITEDDIIVGAPNQDFNSDLTDADAGLNNSGAAYLFEYKVLPEIPVIESSESFVCSGSEVVLTIASGDLEDGEYWEWYQGGCDSDPIGIGASITVLVEETTTYCARGKAFCGGQVDDYCTFVEGDCGCITIEVNDGFWHQSTNEGIYDQANDIITDSEGNVYITGEYMINTTFEGGGLPDVPISAGDGELKSYVAKYDDCGNLRWVAYATDIGDLETGDNNWGTSIVVDELNGLVYASGNFSNLITYHGGIGEDAVMMPSIETAVWAGKQAYVACFDMVTGDVEYVNSVSLDPVTRLNAIVLNKTSGKIYVGGERALVDGQTKAFIQRYGPTSSGIGAQEWLINGLRYDKEKVNDLAYAYDETLEEGSVWIIGNYKKKLKFTPGTSAVGSNYKDAYVTRYLDDVSPTQVFLEKGNINGMMTGEGIAVDEESGNAYMTGTYNGATGDAFRMGHLLFPTSDDYAYFAAISNAGSSVWPLARYTTAPPGADVKGYSVAYTDGKVYFTGSYTTDILPSGGIILSYLNSSSSEPHTYVVAYKAVDGDFEWHNASVDLLLEPAKHIPSAITTDDFGHAYISGGYNRTMGYISGTPSSGDLVAAGQLETFAMRVDLGLSGALESVTNDDSAIGIPDQMIEYDQLGIYNTKSDALVFELYPNPSTGLTSINISSFDNDGVYSFRLSNLQGKVVMEKMIDDDVSVLDLSNISKGVYIAQLFNKDRSLKIKFIKQ